MTGNPRLSSAGSYTIVQPPERLSFTLADDVTLAVTRARFASTAAATRADVRFFPGRDTVRPHRSS